jgi:hypothetical protein
MFQRSVDSGLLVAILRDTKVGDLVSYAQLTGAIGTDVRSGRGYSVLHSARQQLQRERQMVFTVERGIGYRRLSDEQVVEAGGAYVNKVRRAARRGAQLVTSVSSFEGLSPVGKARHNAQLSVFSAIEAVTSQKTVSKLADGQCSAKPLPIAATVEAFREIVASSAARAQAPKLAAVG